MCFDYNDLVSFIATHNVFNNSLFWKVKNLTSSIVIYHLYKHFSHRWQIVGTANLNIHYLGWHVKCFVEFFYINNKRHFHSKCLSLPLPVRFLLIVVC